ncbi:right-handed parallel beta-helix repeat-containing protein [Thalassoglobus sp. JC818]|uniref:FG-GAP-like repeat-containing protein n=1 Tax=Thalassoglobus sp. JC818 TaxID=3232136 RepID=UPI00345841E3
MSTVDRDGILAPWLAFAPIETSFFAPKKRSPLNSPAVLELLEMRTLMSGTPTDVPEAATSGTEIWVDQSSTNPIQNGDSASPFTSINAAINAASEGDTIWVREGVYRETIRLTSDISLRAVPGDHVVLSGSDRITNWTDNGDGTYQTTLDWHPSSLFVNSQEISQSRHPDQGWWIVDSIGESKITDSELIGMDAETLLDSEFYIWTAHGNVQYTVTIIGFDSTTGTITYESPNEIMTIQAGDRFYLTGHENFVSQPGEYSITETAEGFVVTYKSGDISDLDNFEASRRTAVLRAIGVSNVLVDGFEISGSEWLGVEIRNATNVQISNSVITNNQQAGVSLRSSSNVVISQNLITQNGNGIVAVTVSDLRILRNEVAYNRQDGVVIAYNSNNVLIHENYIHHHFGKGHPDNIQTFYNVSNIVISNNLLLAATQQIMMHETQGVVVDGNVMIGSTGNLMTFGHDSVFDVRISNNTAAFAGMGMMRMTGDNYEFYGNIFQTGHDKLLYSTSDVEHTTSDSNLYWHSDLVTDGLLFYDSTGWHKSLESYQSTKDDDQNSVYESPGFANAPLAADLVDVRRLGEMQLDYLPMWRGGKFFEVGDHVEVNYDGIVREVVEIRDGGIVLSVPLDEIPFGHVAVANWGDKTDFDLNLDRVSSTSALLASSDLALASAELTTTSFGASINVPSFQLADFNGDGQRDIPESGTGSTAPPATINLPPTIDFEQSVISIPENTVIGEAIRIGTVQVNDDGVGQSIVSLAGSHAHLFELVGDGLYLKAGTNLDYETSSQLDVSVRVNDPEVGGSVDDSVDVQLKITDVDESPTRVAPTIDFTQTTFSIAENTTLDARLKIGTFSVTQDGFGQSIVSLAGTDAHLFELIGDSLYLKAGTDLDYETDSQFNVSLRVDDPEVGSSVDDSVDVRLKITDVNEVPPRVSPTINFNQTINSVTENATLDARLKIGTFTVTQDGFGQSIVSLAGTDSHLFELLGDGLYLKAGTNLDYETTSQLSVSLQVNDPEVGGSIDDSVDVRLAITDVNEVPPRVSPTIDFNQTVGSIAENTTLSTRLKIGTFTVTQDGFGQSIVTIAGTDAHLFELIGDGLYLKAGTTLDYETDSQFNVSIRIDDPEVGSSVDDSVDIRLRITDVDEAPPRVAPTIELNQTTWSIAEDTTLNTRLKVGTFTVTQDGFGESIVSLAGADAHLFEIIGDNLYLKAGTNLDYETDSQFNVTLRVNDPEVGGSVDDTVDVQLTITDVNEDPNVIQQATNLVVVNGSMAHLGVIVDGELVMIDSVDWQSTGVNELITGDFNGDGLIDVAGVNGSNQIWVGLTDSSGLGTPEKWGEWRSKEVNGNLAVGDFNGDGLDDFISFGSDRRWHVQYSTGNGLELEASDRWAGRRYLKDAVVVGDFNGDGHDDVALSKRSGVWNMSLGSATGLTDSFEVMSWNKKTTWLDVQATDWNGDGLEEISARTKSGDWYSFEFHSTGDDQGTMTEQFLGTFNSLDAWDNFIIADFTGDSTSEIVGVNGSGDWFLMQFTETSETRMLSFGKWAGKNPSLIAAIDIDGNGTADLVGVEQASGESWMAPSLGTQFDQLTHIGSVGFDLGDKAGIYLS